MLEFDKREGVVYRQRPGVYAVVLERGLLAAVQLPNGLYLPGGGVEAGEAPEETLRREVREEIGHEVAAASFLGEAVQYLHPRGWLDGLAKPSRFYRVTLGACVDPCEEEHLLVWLDPARAIERLAHAAQAWAVREATRA